MLSRRDTTLVHGRRCVVVSDFCDRTGRVIRACVPCSVHGRRRDGKKTDDAQKAEEGHDNEIPVPLSRNNPPRASKPTIGAESLYDCIAKKRVTKRPALVTHAPARAVASLLRAPQELKVRVRVTGVDSFSSFLATEVVLVY